MSDPTPWIHASGEATKSERPWNKGRDGARPNNRIGVQLSLQLENRPVNPSLPQNKRAWLPATANEFFDVPHTKAVILNGRKG